MNRLTVREDAPSSRLVALTGALVLAGDEIPKASAKGLHGLARAARGALVAAEPAVAQDLLQRMVAMLEGEEGVYVEALMRKITDLRRAIAWRPMEG